jgi:four helix bundle protein
MAAIERFEDVEGWRLSRDMRQNLIRITQESRQFKDAWLLAQMMNCGDSEMANIAEGFDSGSDREHNRFLKIAYRSLTEFQSHLYSALDENCLTQASFDLLYGKAGKAKLKVRGFMAYLTTPREVACKG